MGQWRNENKKLKDLNFRNLGNFLIGTFFAHTF